MENLLSAAPTAFQPRDWEVQPPYLVPAYKSSVLRAPSQPLVPLKHTLSELTGPVYGPECLGPLDHDLTRNGRVNGEPLGERIIVAGRVLDQFGRPVPDTLVEIWQANAAGRYVHKGDQHDAPLDPNFFGGGRVRTDAEGRYQFMTIKPGSYPWGNHPNAWRPHHIHFSLFGPNIATRLVTQMYFPGDPLQAIDPIFLGTPPKGRELLICRFDIDSSISDYALAYEFNLVLRGPLETPFETR
ncbi:protocatechuate 3,4-dioxygenase subunit beta [Hymenobacter jejuensis]|uniref:Protocatechuate 3,4-dioxygenase subunit beta n=1 Tax=Hymenobacter jejuensis TaxID=2502781 RepID=A0A5B8A580_9BACT|nr:protocatechuate 3,4-dioxygenase subunit beta [Hymenobacter jejuensis]QDA62369.1 protocatechuate 3,4-dioxygenase subunit beta [Hymenobacter jejuensis]